VIGAMPTDGGATRFCSIFFRCGGLVEFFAYLFCDCRTFSSRIWGLFGKVYFPRLTIPMRPVLTNLSSRSIAYSFGVSRKRPIPAHRAAVVVDAVQSPCCFAAISRWRSAFGLFDFQRLSTRYRDLTVDAWYRPSVGCMRQTGFL